ncbi:hypothetical protein ACX3V1_25585 [Escherichia coli]
MAPLPIDAAKASIDIPNARRTVAAVSYTHLRAHETSQDRVCPPLFKPKTAYEILRCLVGSEMCIRDRFTD